jgi:hypothetical protein
MLTGTHDGESRAPGAARSDAVSIFSRVVPGGIMEFQDVQGVVEVLAVEAPRDIGLALLSHVNTKGGHATPERVGGARSADLLIYRTPRGDRHRANGKAPRASEP